MWAILLIRIDAASLPLLPPMLRPLVCQQFFASGFRSLAPAVRLGTMEPRKSLQDDEEEAIIVPDESLCLRNPRRGFG